MSLQQKIDYSINLLRRAEPMALRMSDKGFFLAFSGGKDSQCLYHIAKEAGVTLNTVAQLNLEKLADRAKRGVIIGNGDNR